MDMSGSGLIRAIQNNNMPLLDLLVREAVQNSLDAARSSENNVQVDFGVGRFNSDLLSKELEGITETLREEFPKKEYDYLYIRDIGTEGLTGPLHFSQKGSNQKNNLLKLVYEIAKPQDEKEAGGSWGYGKTIYYRIGIGLVVYYSRILTDDGGYQSRLAVCLVEDEKDPKSLLRDIKLNSRRGLAWWGQSYSYVSGNSLDYSTIPETDDRKISQFLSIFGIEPYTGKDTGTVVIIPYIDERKLLNYNIVQEDRRIPWGDSIEEYLKIAVQRWYIGRLNNVTYLKIIGQPILKVRINNTYLTQDDYSEPFSEMQKLYNMALERKEIDDEKSGYHCEFIRLNNKKYLEDRIVGYIAYKLYSPGELGMLPPENNPSPFIFIKNEEGTDDYKHGDIILSYYRKPGMTVTYDTRGEWVNRIKSNNEGTGDILMVVFVLFSANRFIHPDIKQFQTLEEYFRASERADHMCWYDISVNDMNPRFLDKIQKQVGSKISGKYKKHEDLPEMQNSSLSRLFGDYLLPPQGFGRKPSHPDPSPNPPPVVVKHKNVSMRIDLKNITSSPGFMILPIQLKTIRPLSGIVFSLEVEADGSNISLHKWFERVGITEPFFIKSVRIEGLSVNSDYYRIEKTVNGINNEYSDDNIDIALINTERGISYGLSISSRQSSICIDMKVVVAVINRQTRMGYVLSEGQSL